MSILSGFLKYKKYLKTADNTYKLQSEWTSTDTVHYADGTTATEHIGNIKGITTLTSISDNGYAADMKTVAALINANTTSLGGVQFQVVNGKLQFRYEED